MTVPVDTSVWVDYVSGTRRPDRMDGLIDEGLEGMNTHPPGLVTKHENRVPIPYGTQGTTAKPSLRLASLRRWSRLTISIRPGS